MAKGLETQGIDGPQPKAADMYEIVWDEGLAASAQRYFFSNESLKFASK